MAKKKVKEYAKTFVLKDKDYSNCYINFIDRIILCKITYC